MTRLILIRHAKSSWDTPASGDHGRPLNDRGRAAATAVAEWLQARGHVPERIVTSDAARTMETVQRMLAVWGEGIAVALRPALYHAAPQTMLDLAQEAAPGVIAMVGHNPGIGMLAGALVRAAPEHARFHDYPTCATTVMDFDGAVALGTGRVVDFVVPRDL